MFCPVLGSSRRDSTMCDAQIDFRRMHDGAAATIERVEYDPNRSARIALVRYPEGGWCFSGSLHCSS
jgi:ribosomal protein L2